MKRDAKGLREYKKVCLEIWNERAQEGGVRLCAECLEQIGEWDSELGYFVPKYHNFAHQEGRRTREQCLDKDNIELLCFKCHSERDHNLKVSNAGWLK